MRKGKDIKIQEKIKHINIVNDNMYVFLDRDDHVVAKRVHLNKCVFKQGSAGIAFIEYTINVKEQNDWFEEVIVESDNCIIYVN